MSKPEVGDYVFVAGCENGVPSGVHTVKRVLSHSYLCYALDSGFAWMPEWPNTVWLPRNTVEGQILTAMSQGIHQDNCEAGWWTDLKTGESLTNDPQTPFVKLVMVHSEVSEAVEGLRKGLMDDKLPHRPMCEVELADTIIRILDLAGALGYDIGGALCEKLEFNSRRDDHKIESRLAEGGKTV